MFAFLSSQSLRVFSLDTEVDIQIRVDAVENSPRFPKVSILTSTHVVDYANIFKKVSHTAFTLASISQGEGIFPPQIASLLATQSPCNLIKPDACARRIVRRAYELLSDDNLTAVVVHIVPSEIEISDEIKSRKRPPTDEEPISRNAKKSRRTL